jgi:hypothetical protein
VATSTFFSVSIQPEIHNTVKRRSDRRENPKSYDTSLAVAQLAEAPSYKLEDRGFHSRRINPSGPGIDSASNRSNYQRYILEGKGSRCVRQINLPPPSAECLEILGASTTWSPKGLSRPVCGLPSPSYTGLYVDCLHLPIQACRQKF